LAARSRARARLEIVEFTVGQAAGFPSIIAAAVSSAISSGSGTSRSAAITRASA